MHLYIYGDFKIWCFGKSVTKFDNISCIIWDINAMKVIEKKILLSHTKTRSFKQIKGTYNLPSKFQI